MPKQNKLHYFSFILDYDAMVKDGRCITACGVRRSHLRSTWRMNDVNCEKCKATTLYAKHLAITIASRLKGDITVQTNK